MELDTTTARPRNVDWKRAAAILYGDWGTSKAYVPGIAFAIALYSSFWFVLAVGVLTAIVGVNYIWVCKYFPEGGGVYSSAKAHSRHLALLGGFFLVADYIVTASLSCFDAFLYLGFDFNDAKRWAILAIFAIGMINFFGPRNSGSIAVLLAIATVGVLALLAVACIPQLPAAIQNLQAPRREPIAWWTAFVGVILALSGVEAIANMTGVLRADPNSPPQKPSVAITSTKAIMPVMLEVCMLTTLFGLAMHAIPGMDPDKHAGDMLRYLAEKFVDEPLQGSAMFGWIGDNMLFSKLVGLVLACLLLSAVNTAIVALVSVLYLMAKDDELPQVFSMLNRFGVPWILMFFAILAPILVIDVQKGETALHGLAEMYAIGVVGAITVNLGSTAFNFRLPMLRHERTIMAASFFILLAVELTIAITKPAALAFALCVLGLGGLAVAFHKGARVTIPKKALHIAKRHLPTFSRLSEKIFPVAPQPLSSTTDLTTAIHQQLGPKQSIKAIMVVPESVTPMLRYAVEQARLHQAQLYVLYVRKIFTTIPVEARATEDREAQEIFMAVQSLAGKVEVFTSYAVSDDPASTILEVSASLGVDHLLLGGGPRNRLEKLLGGDLVSAVARNLPDNIKLVIYG